MSSPSLLICTTSQSPLAIKFPRPHKPKLNLPALIHRSLHSALDLETPSISTRSPLGSVIIPHPDTLVKHDVPPNHAHPPQNTSSDPEIVNSTSQPESGGTGSAKGDELEAEITVKLHLIAEGSSSTRAKWVEEALEILKQLKGLTQIDTLLIGFKGIDYKGKRTIAADFFGCGAEGLTSDVTQNISQETMIEARKVWEEVGGIIKDDMVKELGTLYLPLEVLQDLSGSTRAPMVNSLDTPDCHSLPKEYTEFAKEKNIQLWAGGGGEGSDPLPDADLHNLLNEFVNVLNSSQLVKPEMNGSAESIQAISTTLSSAIPLREDGLKYDESAKRGVAVRWVLGYTLISKSRNVLKDKGYIVAADVSP